MQSIIRNRRIYGNIIARYMSKDRAVKAVRPGVSIIIDDKPHKVIKIIQGKRGKGGGFVKATLKAIGVGVDTIFDKTFSSDEIVELADIEREMAQYSWKDGDDCVFLNTSTYEEVRVSSDLIENIDMLGPGMEVKIQKFRDQVVDITLPDVADYTVMRVDQMRLSGKEMPAMLDSGTTIMVPDFIEAGTKVKVNTSSKLYVSRSGD